MINLIKNTDRMEFFTPEDWEGLLVQDALKKKLKVSKKLAYQWRIEKKVFLNGSLPNWGKPLKKGDKVSIEIIEEEESELEPYDKKIDVLFEDEHLIIINKPAYIKTHPNHPDEKDTLANAVSFYYQHKGLKRKVRHIHRLDENTSGAILFAKHAYCHQLLDQMLTERKIKRTYTAYVNGKISPIKGTINEPIGKDRYSSNRQRVSKNGQKAVTHYELYKYNDKRHFSIVNLQLDTGRTHQIRVHLSHIGYPIMGDTLYGGGTERISRQALHAYKIEFVHPITKQKLIINTPVPDDLKRIED
ncbi:RluA family pseudouridine synthase [Bacillus carboniphilus]|uniref:Pseudouridine synthase n=1 Tax=Bacillus carboniphilus TaxID=86663 RepID=A0ABY9JYS1_9BACI|nr:RluA family pseudouridine synthase [Bacillus carboniphilus]WLR42740.1 RluA family pseudouridine synthase [Bacillus carboniphilus]